MTEFMSEAIQEAYKGIEQGHGGPFGTVIVRDGVIVGRGHNRVIYKKDPTCHGEMEAIRDACRNLDTFDLSGCELYTTAEPCPMCLGAVLWANIKTVYYGCNREDTDKIGFRDDKFYEHLAGRTEIVKTKELQRDECQKLFQAYQEKTDRMRY